MCCLGFILGQIWGDFWKGFVSLTHSQAADSGIACLWWLAATVSALLPGERRDSPCRPLGGWAWHWLGILWWHQPGSHPPGCPWRDGTQCTEIFEPSWRRQAVWGREETLHGNYKTRAYIPAQPTMSGFQAAFQLLWACKVGLISPSKAVLIQNQPIFFLSFFFGGGWFLGSWMAIRGSGWGLF